MKNVATNKQINAAIKAATGYDVKLHKSQGVCHFYSDDKDTGLLLARFESTSIYVNTIGTYSVDEWVREFKYLLEINADRIEVHKNRKPYDPTKPLILNYRKNSS